MERLSKNFQAFWALESFRHLIYYKKRRQLPCFFLNSLSPVRVISSKFLLVLSILYQTEWWWELRTWSQKMNLIDTYSTLDSSHYFYLKPTGTTIDNLNFNVMVFKGKHYCKYLVLPTELMSVNCHSKGLALQTRG